MGTGTAPGIDARSREITTGGRNFKTEITLETNMAKPAPAVLPAAPPAGLSPAMECWWQDVVKEHELEPHRLRLLEFACRAYDRCEEARLAIAQHGTTYPDRFGAPRLRPEVAIERDSRQAFARLLRDLDLRAPSPFPF
jgi:phage terminase small subunit